MSEDVRMAMAYEFVLPIVFKGFWKPETQSYLIPGEIGYDHEGRGGLFGPQSLRLKAVGRALKMVDQRSSLHRDKAFYKSELADLAIAHIRDGKPIDDINAKLKEIDEKIKRLEFDASGDIKLIYASGARS